MKDVKKEGEGQEVKTEEKKVEKKEKKSQKERPRSKTKHAKVQVWKLYNVKDGKLQRRESCPRCGAGTILAQHKNRKWCGKCFWSIIESKTEG